jgi:hypothetical protein
MPRLGAEKEHGDSVEREAYETSSRVPDLPGTDDVERPPEREGDVTSPLPVLPATELACAFVGELAARQGIRILFIKGLPAAEQGLRDSADGHSVDVDVLVEPRRHGDLAQVIASLGWRARRPVGARAGARAEHSITLCHAEWPCDIDLHHFFPGLFAGPERVFDHLWETRSEVVVGGRTVGAPAPADHALVLLCNALRDQGGSKARSDLERLARLIDAGELSWDAVLRTARTARAGSVILPFARDRGYELPAEDLGRHELMAWELSTGAAGGLGAFVYWFPRSTWPQRWGMVKDALSADRAQLAARDPEWSRRGMSHWRGNLRRILRGVRETPALLRGLSQLRRSAGRRPEEARGGAPSSASRVLAASRGEGPDIEGLGIPYLEPASDGPLPEESLSPSPVDDPGARALGGGEAGLVLKPYAAASGRESLYVLPLAPLGERRMPRALTLDRSGEEVVGALRRGPQRAEALVESLAARHEVPEEEVREGVFGFVEELLRRDLVELVPSS